MVNQTLHIVIPEKPFPYFHFPNEIHQSIEMPPFERSHFEQGTRFVFGSHEFTYSHHKLYLYQEKNKQLLTLAPFKSRTILVMFRNEN